VDALAYPLRSCRCMNAENARLHLLAQHDRLRERLETCRRVARLYRARLASSRELDAVLGVLREELTHHNHTEADVIRTLLHGPAAWGSLMIDRMLEEHIAEHVAFESLLFGTTAEVASRIDDLAEELDAHMAAEERTFLAPVTLRDDVIKVRTREEPAD
jgi:iron-sulfur cluster repair protein YtfE (RIC family)